MNQDYRIKLASPQIDEEAGQAVIEVLRSGQLVAGPKVERFEGLLAKVSGRRHVVATSSGTAALICAMKSLGIGQGDVVVVPAFTFPAPAMAAEFLGATVRICDVDSKTFNVSKETLGPSLDGDVSLVVAVDQFGAPAPAGEIGEMCRRLGIPLLVDAACSLGSTLDGRPCGSFGDMAIYSFHPRKVVTTGEGGAVLTDDDELANMCRRARNVGYDSGGFAGPGINLRPSEISAALGISQLKGLGAELERRADLVKPYGGVPLDFQEPISGATVNHQTVACVVDRGGDGSGRDALKDFLGNMGIESKMASYSLCQVDWLRERFGYTDRFAPNSLDLHRNALALPMHSGLRLEDVDYVVSGIVKWNGERGAKG